MKMIKNLYQVFLTLLIVGVLVLIFYHSSILLILLAALFVWILAMNLREANKTISDLSKLQNNYSTTAATIEHSCFDHSEDDNHPCCNDQEFIEYAFTAEGKNHSNNVMVYPSESLRLLKKGDELQIRYNAANAENNYPDELVDIHLANAFESKRVVSIFFAICAAACIGLFWYQHSWQAN